MPKGKYLETYTTIRDEELGLVHIES